MRVTAGSVALVIDWSNLDKNIALLIREVSSDSDAIRRMYLVLKPSVITIMVRGIKRQIVIPPSSIIVEREVIGNEKVSKLLNKVISSGSIRSYKLVEDSWIEGKHILFSNNMYVLGKSILSEVIRKYLSINYVDNPRNASCLVVDSDYSLNISEYYEKILNNKHVAMLSMEPSINVKGRLHSNWRHHPILYGLNIWGFQVNLKVSLLNRAERLKLLAKPIAYVNEYPLLLELSHNNSIVYTSALNIEPLILKSILYVC